MKKIFLLIVLMIFIPYFIVNFFIKDENIKFYYTSNMVVRVKREKTGLVEKVPFEDYVVGVLAGEMPVNFELEALKSQAVAARTYVLKKLKDNYKKEYDILDTVDDQVYISEDELKIKWEDKYLDRINKIKQAVLDTKGEYLTYDGEIIEALFFSTSVGKTENSEEIFSKKLPYLRSVDSSWDEEVSPVFNDSFEFSLQEFYDRLNMSYSDEIKVKITKSTSTGRVKEVLINGNKFSGSKIYSLLDLRSTHFSINQIGNNIIIKTKGYGHGVGLSQYGALAMAKKGYTYKEILSYYYLGTDLEKI